MIFRSREWNRQPFTGIGSVPIRYSSEISQNPTNPENSTNIA